MLFLQKVQWGLEENRQFFKKQRDSYVPSVFQMSQSYVCEQETLTMKSSAKTICVSWVILWIRSSVMNILIIVVLSGRFCRQTVLWALRQP